MTIQVKADATACCCCAGELYLLATLPHPTMAESSRQVRLCPRCDADKGAAQGLLSYFAVHGSAREGDSDFLARLIKEWLDAATAARFEESGWSADYEMWKSGEL
ncbi:DUF6300 family protein [Catellatospora chokoriensis]|uniref:Uncharacterized protein n=1 Tax=Catellatospora chokoriensis TaxID=310353 RepID=A0A8J3NSD4_9ACTN|nr:DUF6300 family protein [Catellatospora chokoriensis]GIF90403.1 hypothetical protein Cch02nite_38470 [Catellatospora chokoriensis]